jgi:hypothetical protein
MPIRTVGLTPEHRWCGALRSVKPAVNNGKGAHGLVHGPNSLNATSIRPGRISDRTRKLAKNLRNGHLERLIPPGWHVGKEDPVVVSEWSKPEPDLSIVRGRESDYLRRAVTGADVALVVEIAESSLLADRSEMSKVYARARIPIYWIINLIDRQVEVYTQPADNCYQHRQDFAPDQFVPVVIEDREVGRILVSDIVP